MLEQIRANLSNSTTILGVGVVAIFATIVIPLPALRSTF